MQLWKEALSFWTRDIYADLVELTQEMHIQIPRRLKEKKPFSIKLLAATNYISKTVN